MIGLLTPVAAVADLLDVAPGTLRRACRKEIARGRANTTARLKAVLYRSAMAGNVRALTFLIERLDPAFVLRRDNDAVILPPGETRIIVKGGLPEGSWENGEAEEPRPNGHDPEP